MFSRIVHGDLFSCLHIIFNGTDHAFAVVFMDRRGRFRIDRRQLFMHIGIALLRRFFLKLSSECRVRFFCRKRYIIQNSLNIKSGSADQNRNMSPLINALHRFLRHLRKPEYIKFFIRRKDVDQMMSDTVHFPRQDLGRANIHLLIHLHGIRRNDLSADRLRQFDGKLCFPYCRRPGQYQHFLFLHRLNLRSSSYLLMEMIVGLPCGQL